MSSNRPTARDVLDPGHPLCRTCDQIDAVSAQALACLALLLGVTIGAYPVLSAAAPVVISDAAVLAVLVGLRLALVSERYRRARVVLIERGAPDLAELRDVDRRLGAQARRKHLAAELLSALDIAQRWGAVPVARRPPPGVRRLASHAGAVRAIAGALEAPAPDVRAAAMVEELLDGGYAAPLYHLDARALGEELGRIRFRLEADPSNDGHSGTGVTVGSV
jgi:hypothetical protein